jgi:hypothetical protein
MKQVLALAAVLVAAEAARACWADVPLEKVVGQSPLVVTGTIERVVRGRGQHYRRRYGVAFIKVSKVLKNQVPHLNLRAGDRVRLFTLLPSVPRLSTDIYYTKGQSGVWILQHNVRSRLFEATYPKDRQPMSQEKTVVGIING